LLLDVLDETEQFWRSQGEDRLIASFLFKPPLTGERQVYNHINMSSIFVLDQDKAIDFYVGTLGMELTNNMDLGFMRWVTVAVPGQPGRDVLLELPGPPAMDEKTALKARRVEFTSEPEEHFYGTDFGIRDPFGNNIRIVQLATVDNGMPKTLEGRPVAKR
jgi:catechol 2,3-dioxygenase-like lactoylglutathione lyase family enzyme